MTAVVIRREVKTQRERHTGRTASDNGSRDWRDLCYTSRNAKCGQQPPEARTEAWTRSSLRGRANLANNLYFVSVASRTIDNTFLLF